MLVDGEKMARVARAKTMSHPGEGIAVAQEHKFDLGVVEGREEIEDFRYFGNSIPDDVTGEWNVSDRRAKEKISGGRGARDAAVEGVEDVVVGGHILTAPDQRFLGIEVKPDFRPFA